MINDLHCGCNWVLVVNVKTQVGHLKSRELARRIVAALQQILVVVATAVVLVAGVSVVVVRLGLDAVAISESVVVAEWAE